MGPKGGAGQLTERVTFERRAVTADGYGNSEGDWATLITGRDVSLRPSRGSEQVIAARQQGVSMWDLWVRYDRATAAVTPGDRVVDARNTARTFNVKFAEDMDGQRTWILMQLEQGAADG